mgnify:CR=1 FL=1
MSRDDAADRGRGEDDAVLACEAAGCLQPRLGLGALLPDQDVAEDDERGVVGDAWSFAAGGI